MYSRKEVWQTMECRKAEQLMQPFVEGTLDISKMREFVEHVENCQNCYEDLEIHVLVQEGFARLESGSAFDLKREMQERLHTSNTFILRREKLLSVIYIIELAAGMTVGILMAALVAKAWI